MLCALMITLYLMKFDLMQSMIGEWMHFLYFIDVLLNVQLVLNDIERGETTYTSRILSI